jgi:hypothetical protein
MSPAVLWHKAQPTITLPYQPLRKSVDLTQLRHNIFINKRLSPRLGRLLVTPSRKPTLLLSNRGIEALSALLGEEILDIVRYGAQSLEGSQEVSLGRGLTVGRTCPEGDVVGRWRDTGWWGFHADVGDEEVARNLGVEGREEGRSGLCVARGYLLNAGVGRLHGGWVHHGVGVYVIDAVEVGFAEG